MTENKDKVVEVNGVWKIFGARADEALEAIRNDGLSKAEVLEKFQCVVGVKDATFSAGEGEIFCIMGLSGSGKSTCVTLPALQCMLGDFERSIIVNDVKSGEAAHQARRSILAEGAQFHAQRAAIKLLA